MRSYHLTTFGCQMNEHDSERMKGMLESLGYVEAPTRADADLILFNTCSIREKADERFIAHLARPSALKRARPDVVVGVGGCWAQSVKDEVFAALPVRRCRVRTRAGAQARRVPDERLADRPGLLRVRRVHRAPAGQARS
jgi:tRNA A37 methylthiotransferase MiaB